MVAACLLALPARASLGGVVAEREILLRNTLDFARQNELVVVCLDDLDVPEDVERSVVDAEVVNDGGEPLTCQFDPFGQVEGFRSEVAFETDLKPWETQRVLVRLLDQKREKQPPPFRVSGKDGQFVVTTPVYSIKVSAQGGLSALQPKITPPKKTEAQAEDELFGETEEAATEPDTLLPTGSGPALNAPFAGDGLPFAVNGMAAVGDKTAVKTWAGPVRAVIAVYDAGPWRIIADKVVPFAARQSLSFPRQGRQFFLDLVLRPGSEVPAGKLFFGGLRVDSESKPWQLIMGQNGKPPQVSPVNIVLRNSKRIVLEGYQMATFSHYWAQAVAKDSWAAVVIDRNTGNIGDSVDWGTGQRLMPAFMHLEDKGPYTDSVQTSIRFSKLPVGLVGRARAAVYFGGKDDKPADIGPLSDRFNSPLPVARQVVKTQAALDITRLQALLKERSVVVVVPDVDPSDRSELWNRFSDRLAGTWRRSRAFLQYFNVFCGEKPPADLLVVLVGEPGTNGLLDQVNQSEQVFSAYPLGEDRTSIHLLEKPDWPGAVLFVAGNGEKATAKAVEQVTGMAGELPPRPEICLSPHPWADKMPVPWAAIRDYDGAFKTTAYRNGHADFLFLLRANRKVSGVKLAASDGSKCRLVPWQFLPTGSTVPQVTPVHDAAFPVMPTELERDQLLAVWISLKIAGDEKPGVRRDTATLTYGDKSRPIPLETEVLSPVLTDRPGFGFYPMGEGKAGMKLYYGWKDDADYYQHLPRILSDRGEFGPNAFTLDIGGFALRVGQRGELSIDSSEFEKELAAVRSANCIDRLLVGSLNYLRASDFRKIPAADEYDAWEQVAPVFRAKLRQLGLEDQLICQHDDEIGDYEAWLPLSRLYKRCGVKMSVAINGYGVFNKHLGVGTMGFWIPLYNFYLNRWGNPVPDDDSVHFSRKFRDERHAAGEEIWPYVCGPGPYAWSSRPRSQARFLILDAYMKGADGLSYYGGTCWSHAVDPAYRSTKKADLFGGDCTFVTLFYPDYERGGILPSLRAGSFRLGLEDVTATKVIREMAAKKGLSEQTEGKIAGSCATIDMDSPDQPFDAHRRKLAEIYAELAK
jgi:hypothetical protein